jgi:hypothetical protein
MKKIKTKKFKKRILFILLPLIFLLLTGGTVFASAQTPSEADLEQNLNNTILEQLSYLDFSSLDEMINTLNFDNFSPFGTGSFKDKVKEIISGEFKDGYTSVFEAILFLTCRQTQKIKQ